MLFGKHINRYYLRYAPVLFIGIVALVAVDYVQLLVPELYKMIINGMNEGIVEIDSVSHAFDMNFLLEYICKPMIFIILAMVVGRFIWRICFFGSGIKVETNLRERMFDHCKDLSQQYYQVNKVGNLMSLFTNDLETVQDCFGSGILMFCDALFLGLLSVYKMWLMNPFLTLFCLIPMAFLFAIGSLVGHSMEKKWDKRQAAYSALSDFAQESFSGIAVIKAFVKEFKELLAFRKLNKNNEDANVEFTRISVLLNISVTLFVESVICVILGYGGYLVHRGVFNAGQLIEFIGYFTAIVWPVMAISELIEMASRGKASLKRIGELLDAKTDVIDREDVTDVDRLLGNIEIRHLTFRYPSGDYDVLKDVSFTIEAGENVGIIGRTGSGKTTLVDLILRTYNVPDGTVFLDGRDINSIPIHTVREFAAYVPQDNYLFSDTIEHNIAFASDIDDIDSVRSAAKMSDVDDNIVAFANGYQTVLGERGVTVSAVDVQTERAILSNLRSIRKGKTTILIAHRISTIEQMDKIIFLDEGRVAAVGTHEELCRTCPDYKTMVDLQKLDDKEANSHA